jgi:hypothetical protein
MLAGRPEAQQRQILLESGGNPFYIEQLLRASSASRSAGCADRTPADAPQAPLGCVCSAIV